MGLNGWRFQPRLMPAPHRHSDIEINFLLDGSITYLHRERIVSIASGRLAIFWGAIPHQLTERPEACDMCILTIPLELFLGWKLPTTLTQPLLAGELLVDQNQDESAIDRLLFPRWHQDLAAERRDELRSRMSKAVAFCLGQRLAKGSAKGGPKQGKEKKWLALSIIRRAADRASGGDTVGLHLMR